MTRPAVLPPGVFVPADVCAELGPALATLLARARSDRAAVAADTVEPVELIVRVGQSWERRAEVPVPTKPNAVSTVDTPGFDVQQSISVKEAKDILSITEQAVTKRCRAGTLRAEVVKGAWRIDPSSLRKETDERAS